MKTQLTLLALLLTQFAFGQITITNADMPNIGESYTLSVADTLLLLDPAPTGANFTWDFSTLEHASQTEVEFISPTGTSIFYVLLWSISDAAAQLGLSLDLGGIGIENIFQFFSESSSEYSVTGFGGEVTGVPIPVVFDQPDILYKFPMDFGNVDSSTSGFNVGLPGVATIFESSSRLNEVDGWGSLTTPYGTFDVLRLKSTVVAHDSIESTAGNFVIDRIATEYKWIGANTGLPLLQIDVQDIGGVPIISQITYQDSLREDPLAVPTPPIVDLTVFPNPASTQFSLGGIGLTDSEVEISLHATDGRKISELFNGHLPATAFRRSFSIENLSLNNGLYFVEIKLASANNGNATAQRIPLYIFTD